MTKKTTVEMIAEQIIIDRLFPIFEDLANDSKVDINLMKLFIEKTFYKHIAVEKIDYFSGYFTEREYIKNIFTTGFDPEDSKYLRPYDQFTGKHQIIIIAMHNILKNNEPIELLTVTEELAKQKTLEEIGGISFLVDLTTN